MSLPISLAGSSVAPMLRCLRAVGFCRQAAAGVAGAGHARLAHQLYHVFALLVISTYVVQQLIYAYQVRDDMEKLSNVLFLMLCHMTCIAKQLVFHADARRIDLLIAGLDEPLYNPQAAGGEAARALLARTAWRARRLARVYPACAVATCLLWMLFQVLDRARGRAVEFSFWVPFDTAHTAKFLAVLVYSFYTTNLVGVGNTTMDAFIATVLHQCKTQLSILRMNLETLTQRARVACGAQHWRYNIVCYELLIESLVHYQKITDTCSLLQDIFGTALLVQFGVGGWILCMAAYKIVSLEVMSIEFVSTTLFILCILIELLLYCYYGNEVTVESDRVVQSMYAMSWLRTSRRVRRALLVAMERAQRPLRPAAGRVVPLTLDTYVTILKSSYSFYAVLRQTK